MNCFSFFVLSFVLISVFAVSATAQMEKEHAGSLCKVAIINSKIFRNKDSGIKEVSDAYDKVETELKSQSEELKLMAEEIKKREN
jgi:hypothetical protein